MKHHGDYVVFLKRGLDVARRMSHPSSFPGEVIVVPHTGLSRRDGGAILYWKGVITETAILCLPFLGTHGGIVRILQHGSFPSGPQHNPSHDLHISGQGFEEGLYAVFTHLASHHRKGFPLKPRLFFKEMSISGSNNDLIRPGTNLMYRLNDGGSIGQIILNGGVDRFQVRVDDKGVHLHVLEVVKL